MRKFNPSYRFYLVNTCVSEELTPSSIFCSSGFIRFTVSGGHGMQDGQFVSLTGWDTARYLNGFWPVTIIDGLTIELPISCTGIPDTSVTGLIFAYTTVQQAYPGGFFDEGSYSYELQTPNIFYRKTLTSDLIFFNDPGKGITDYDYLKNIYDNYKCCEVKLIIQKNCNGEWIEDYKGYFTHVDGTWNLNKCFVSIKTYPDDIYRCLLSNGDTKINIIEVGTPLEQELALTLSPRFTIVTYIENDPTCTFASPPVGTGWTNVYTACPPGIRVWARQIIVTNCDETGTPVAPPADGLDAWVLDSDDCATNGTATYVRGFVVGSFGNAGCSGGIPNPFLEFTPTGYRQFLFYEDCANNIALTTLIPQDGGGTFPLYWYGQNINERIDYILANTCEQVTGMRSNLFEHNPIDDNPDVPYTPGLNYVIQQNNVIFTEVEDETNTLDRIFIFQKSDFLLQNGGQSATKALISFNDMMDILREMFNMYWFVDEDGFVRIEHISWFTRTQILSLIGTSINTDSDVVSFENEQRPGVENYSFMEAQNDDFSGLPITYDSPCTVQNFKIQTVEHSVTDVTTDVQLILDDPGSIALSGFVLVTTWQNSIYPSQGKITGAFYYNNDLSWANLHFNYHRWERVLLSGNMNGNVQPFATQTPTRKQIAQYYIDCCFDFSPFRAYIETSQGNGTLKQASFSIKNNLYSFDLTFTD